MNTEWTKADTLREEEKEWLLDYSEYGRTPLEERAYAIFKERNI